VQQIGFSSAISFEKEKFIDAFLEPLAQKESQKCGGAVLSSLNRADGLARHADEFGKFLLRNAFRQPPN
jgi:hypothetical protein